MILKSHCLFELRWTFVTYCCQFAANATTNKTIYTVRLFEHNMQLATQNRMPLVCCKHSRRSAPSFGPPLDYLLVHSSNYRTPTEDNTAGAVRMWLCEMKHQKRRSRNCKGRGTPRRSDNRTQISRSRPVLTLKLSQTSKSTEQKKIYVCNCKLTLIVSLNR